MKHAIRQLLVVGTFAAMIPSAGATVLDFDLNYNFGTVDAGGDVLVSITEAATAGDVAITVTNHTLGFLNDLSLNYSPSSDIANATIYGFDVTVGTVGEPSVQYNALQGFAIDFGYVVANNANRFNPGESVTFDLTATGDLLVNSFNVLGGHPTGEHYYAAAHVNDVTVSGACGGGSAKVGDTNGGNVAGGGNLQDCGGGGTSGSVPEPQTLALIGIALLCIIAVGARRNGTKGLSI